MKIIQYFAFKLYASANKLGIFEYRFFEQIFAKAYYVYKSKLENIDIALIAKHIRPNSTIIDVGANIGWFTVNIMKYLNSDGFIIAVEPDLTNLRRLESCLIASNLQDRVQILPIALSNIQGTGFLTLDSGNPANHKIGEEEGGISKEIELKLLDDVCRNLVDVCLVKIDVQGHEINVLKGGQDTIMRLRPAILIEFDNRHGFQNTGDVWELLQKFGYKVFFPEDQRNALSKERLCSEKNYFDCICLPI